MSYPVQLQVRPPTSYDRIQLLLRLLVGIGLGWLGLTAGALLGIFYLMLPALAGIAISTRGAEVYETELGRKLWRLLEWVFAFSAYMLLVTDRFPVDHDDVSTELRTTAKPTLGSALLRLLTSLPSAFVLALLGCVSWILVLVAAVTILLDRSVPAAILRFQLGMLRWQARLAAYHASLVDEYPPFSFEHDASHTAMPAAS